MAAQAHDTGTTSRPPRRADAGTNRPDQRRADPETNRPDQRRADARTNRHSQRRADAETIRLSQRDIDGLLLAGEHYGAPYDLLADALRVQPDRLRKITARWRRAGYVATGRLGPGPGWCWLTPDGMAATGLGFPARPPGAGAGWRTSARCSPPGCGWQAGPAWATGGPGGIPNGGCAPTSPRPAPRARARRRDPLAQHRRQPVRRAGVGIEVELTPKPVARTTRIMAGLLVPDAVRAGGVPDRPGRPAGGDPGRGLASARGAGPGRDPGPARRRVHPGGPPR